MSADGRWDLTWRLKRYGDQLSSFTGIENGSVNTTCGVI
jgi:hypothetical protein